jgi:hypothetical protein
METEQQAGSGGSIDVAEQYDSDARRRQGGKKVAQVAVLAPHARSSRRGQRREAGARRDPLRRRDAPTGTGGPALSLVGPSDAGREKETLPPLGSSELTVGHGHPDQATGRGESYACLPPTCRHEHDDD